MVSHMKHSIPLQKSTPLKLEKRTPPIQKGAHKAIQKAKLEAERFKVWQAQKKEKETRKRAILERRKQIAAVLHKQLLSEKRLAKEAMQTTERPKKERRDYFLAYQRERWARNSESILRSRRERRAFVREQAGLKRQVNPSLYPAKSFKDLAARRMWNSAARGAPKRGLDFDIELTDIVVPDCCPISGVSFDPNAEAFVTPSLDRINSSKGYIKGNIAVISSWYNTLKRDGTPEDFEKLLAWLKKVMAGG